ncbi:MAG: hypothetical protein ACRDUY_00320 [Nitriliruptorales bacterium]
MVDPWGRVVATAADGDALLVADLEPTVVKDARRSMPALDRRRPDVYSWPVSEVGVDG